jgi:hypothetical protein
LFRKLILPPLVNGQVSRLLRPTYANLRHLEVSDYVLEE